ncbi:MAG: hypothetical protein M5U28_47300 [Sandaracinaceae bacterium]|nr:hypothetical protein [Sandaracinaceae bacterium]
MAALIRRTGALTDGKRVVTVPLAVRAAKAAVRLAQADISDPLAHPAVDRHPRIRPGRGVVRCIPVIRRAAILAHGVALEATRDDERAGQNHAEAAMHQSGTHVPSRQV